MLPYMGSYMQQQQLGLFTCVFLRLPQEVEPWVRALAALFPSLAKAVLLEVVLPVALTKCQVNESVRSRVLGCRLLGAITPQLSKEDVHAYFSSQVLTMCQDTDYQVGEGDHSTSTTAGYPALLAYESSSSSRRLRL